MNYKRRLSIEILDAIGDNYGLDWGGEGNVLVKDNFSRLYYLESGSAEVRVGSVTVKLTPGKLYLFPSNTASYYKCTSPMKLHWLHFSIEFSNGLDILSCFSPPFESATPVANALNIYHQIYSKLTTNNPHDYLHAVALLSEILTPFIPNDWDQIRQQCQPDIDRLAPVIAYLQSNWNKTDITLKQLAKQVHLHPTYFSNLFKKLFKRSPMQFLNDLRMQHARELLNSTAVPVSEIADKCGYHDPLYFSKAFKKNVGVSPRKYRECGGYFHLSATSKEE